MDYLSDEDYANLTGNGPANDYVMDPSQGASDYSLEPYWDVQDPSYYDLASQLSQAGLIPQDQFGAPDLSALLGGQYSDALSSGNLGDLSQYSAPTDAVQQMAMQQANLVGSGFEEVPGNPNVVVDPATGELVDKVNLADYMSGNGLRSGATEGLRAPQIHDILGGLGVDSSGGRLQTGVLGSDKYLSGLMLPGAPDKPERLSDAQILGDPGTVDAWGQNADHSWENYAKENGYDRMTSSEPSLLQKLGSGALSLLKGDGAGGRALPGNSNNMMPQGQKQGMSLASMLALAAGALQRGSKGLAPGDHRVNPGAQNWQVSRKAGSGRKNKAAGGLLQMAAGGRPSGGQDDVVPINAAHGEYIFDADTVSALGDGNTEAGAAKLDEMRHNIRKHKRSAPPDKIPPKARGALQYLKGGK